MSSCTAKSRSRAATPTRPTTTSSSVNSISACKFLQLPYRSPAAHIAFAAAGIVDDRPAEREMRVGDFRGAASRDCFQPLGIEIGPRRRALRVERVEQADMRRDKLRRAANVTQPSTKFAHLGSVLDLDKDGET